MVLWRTRRVVLLMTACLAVWAGRAHGQGAYMPGAGPDNLAMMGASTAAPIDAQGATLWNPAAMSRLQDSEVALGVAFGYPTSHFSSSLTANIPIGGTQITIRGTKRADNGLLAAPSFGVVYHLKDTNWTFGMNFVAIAGANDWTGSTFCTNPSSTANCLNSLNMNANPILALMGSTYLSMTIMQLSPMLSYQLNDEWAFGAGPMIDAAMVQVNPAFISPPNSISLLPPHITYKTAVNGRPYWGGGLQGGLSYTPRYAKNFSLGFSVKSPQWIERFEWDTNNEYGAPTTVSVQSGLPLILSLGLGYKGSDSLEGLTLDLDGRWFQWSAQPLFGSAVAFKNTLGMLNTPPTGPYFNTLGWQDVWSIAIGGEYRIPKSVVEVLDNRVFVRAGYMFNTNPIPSNSAVFNYPLGGLPTISNWLSVGLGYQFNEDIRLGASYMHGFTGHSGGPINQINNLIPGQKILYAASNLSASIDAAIFGAAFIF